MGSSTQCGRTPGWPGALLPSGRPPLWVTLPAGKEGLRGARRPASEARGVPGVGWRQRGRRYEGGAAPASLSSGLHLGGRAALADCIRRAIIDQAVVYPWCLISINSSLKELAGDSGSLPPPSSFAPSSFGFVRNRRFMRIRVRFSFVPRTRNLCIEGTARPVVLVPSHGAAGKGCRAGGHDGATGRGHPSRVLPWGNGGASLGQEGVAPECLIPDGGWARAVAVMGP